MSGLEGLAQEAIERRVKYYERLQQEVLKELKPDFTENVHNLMGVPLTSDNASFLENFMEYAKNNPYFQELHEKIKDKPFTWETLEQIEEIAGESYNHYQDIFSGISQASAEVDRFYLFTNSLASTFPRFYTNPDLGVEPNCVGATQIITALYGFEHDVSDLEYINVITTSRTDTLLQALKEHDSLTTFHEKEVEELEKMLNECPGSEGLRSMYEKYVSESRIPGPYDNYVEFNLDTFSGSFEKEELRTMILNQVLDLEEQRHGAIRNKKTGEIYDFEMERENIKRYETVSIESGLYTSAASNLFQTLHSSGGFRVDNPEDVSQLLRCEEGSPIEKWAKYTAFQDTSEGNQLLEDIRQDYGNDCPASYNILWIGKQLEQGNTDAARDQAKALQEKYSHPRTLEILAERYQFPQLLSLE